MSNKIMKQIRQLADGEFETLRDSIAMDIRDGDSSYIQNDLLKHLESCLTDTSVLLLDSLINELMKYAQDVISNSPISVQNDFYDLNLREKLREGFELNSEIVQWKGISTIPVFNFYSLFYLGYISVIIDFIKYKYFINKLVNKIINKINDFEVELFSALEQTNDLFFVEFKKFAKSNDLQMGDMNDE